MKKNKLILGAIMLFVALMFTGCKHKCSEGTHNEGTQADEKIAAYTNGNYLLDAVVYVTPANLPKSKFKVYLSLDTTRTWILVNNESANFIDTKHQVPWDYKLMVKVTNIYDANKDTVYVADEAHYNDQHDNTVLIQTSPNVFNHFRRIEITVSKKPPPAPGDSYKSTCNMVPDQVDYLIKKSEK